MTKDNPETKWQLDAKICGVLMEVRAEGSWECKPYLEWLYAGGTTKPDCSKCRIPEKY